MRTIAAFAKPRISTSASPFIAKHMALLALILASLAVFTAPSAQAQYSATPTSFSVTDAGASSLSIPIYTPPMPGGMDVKLSLQYNSQASNGVFGVGWNLSGVSSITRCPKTIAEEGERIGVKNDATDVFCLDGQKLRAVAGVYGAAGTEYRTAIDSYSQIISNGDQAGGPVSFTVKTKSGLIMEFGGLNRGNYSMLLHPTKRVARTWMLTRIKDRFDNQVYFQYTSNDNSGEQLLRFINMGNGHIEIQYTNRPEDDKILKYDDGVQLGSTNQRAYKIVVTDAPQLSDISRPARPFKEYRLNYSQSTTTQRSLLSSVQECANDGACLPAVTMDYNSAGQVGFKPGEGVYLGDPRAIGVEPILVDDQGNGKPRVMASASAPNYALLSAFQNNPVNVNVSTYDIDNDSKTDYIYDVSGKDQQGNKVYSTSQQLSSNGEFKQIASGQVRTCFADLDGNGTSEPVVISSNYVIGQRGDSYTVFVNGIAIGTARAALIGDVYQPLGGYSCQAADTNGDGRAEVIIKLGNGLVSDFLAYENYRGNITYSLVNGQAKVSNFWGINIGQKIGYVGLVAGDFNGDGKTDVVLSRTDYTGFFYHTGGASPEPTLMNSYVPQAGWQGEYGCSGDFNGDGRTDLAAVNLDSLVNGSPSIDLFLSQNLNFRKERAALTINSSDMPAEYCADFNGDGLTDLFMFGQYHYNTLPVAVDALKYVNTGLGHNYTVDYKSITDNSVYTKYSGEQLPRVDLQTPISVVRTVTEVVSGTDPVVTNYLYYGLKADLKRRGTLGFKTVQSINKNTGITNSTDYHQIYPLIGLKEGNQKWLSNRKFEEIKYSYYTSAIGAGTSTVPPTSLGAQVEVNQITAQQWDANGNGYMGYSLDTINGIDSLGNPRFTDHQEFDASGARTSQRVTEYTYTNNTANWLIGQVSSSKTTSTNLRSLPITLVGASAGADAASQSGQPPPPPVVPLTLAQKAAMTVISNLLLAD
jgi:hypothetical protein